jgi:hypothetical protein
MYQPSAMREGYINVGVPSDQWPTVTPLQFHYTLTSSHAHYHLSFVLSMLFNDTANC